MDLTSIIRSAAKEIVAGLKDEFEQQGHKATGKGLDSIHEVIEQTDSGFLIKIVALDYLIYVNMGRDAGKMPPVSKIKEWVKVVITQDEQAAESIAWAIAKTIEKEGIPTSGAYRYSSNGRRVGFIDYVRNTLVNEVLERMARRVEKEAASSFFSFVKSA